MTLLILRPQPGAAASAARARRAGLEPRIVPLFAIDPVEWRAPAAGAFDRLLLTSANAVRATAGRLGDLAALPCWCVGAATAEAARAAGLQVERQGDTNLRDLLALAPSVRLLWLSAEEHTPLDEDIRQAIAIVPVYRARALVVDPADLTGPAVALLHSTRAARRMAELAPDRSAIAIVAISGPVARAAGSGWADVAAAARSDDAEMVAIAARLCHKSGKDQQG